MIRTCTSVRRYLRLFAAFIVLAAVPFIANMQHAAAQPMMMHHAMNNMNAADCVTFCATRASTVPKPVLLYRDEVRTPDPTPKPNEPYFVQFQQTHTPKALYPSRVFGPYSIRPPDIVTQSANFRF